MSNSLSGNLFEMHILFLVSQSAQAKPAKHDKPNSKLTPSLFGIQSEMSSINDLG
jgi:hypothetical protein